MTRQSGFSAMTNVLLQIVSIFQVLRKKKETWLLGEFEGRWATRRQGGEWGTDVWDSDRTGVSEWLSSHPHGNVGTVRMDTSACRCRRDIL